jgi:hypothetical protein
MALSGQFSLLYSFLHFFVFAAIKFFVWPLAACVFLSWIRGNKKTLIFWLCFGVLRWFRSPD